MMERSQLVDELKTLAAKRFQRELAEVGADDDFFEVLGIDSFQAMELMTDLEDHYDVEIPDYELQGVKSFGALADVLATRL